MPRFCVFDYEDENKDEEDWLAGFGLVHAVRNRGSRVNPLGNALIQKSVLIGKSVGAAYAGMFGDVIVGQYLSKNGADT